MPRIAPLMFVSKYGIERRHLLDPLGVERHDVILVDLHADGAALHAASRLVQRLQIRPQAGVPPDALTRADGVLVDSIHAPRLANCEVVAVVELLDRAPCAGRSSKTRASTRSGRRRRSCRRVSCRRRSRAIADRHDASTGDHHALLVGEVRHGFTRIRQRCRTRATRRIERNSARARLDAKFSREGGAATRARRS